MQSVLFIIALLLGVFAGCTSTPTRPTPGSAPASAPGPVSGVPASPGAAASAPAPVVHTTLAAEQRRLSDLFRGTPVVFSLQADGSLRVEVPLGFCFDRGAFVVKPPLAAVLDRLASSQRNEATRLRVTAAADAGGGGPTLARERAASTRDYLVARGVIAIRVAIASVAQGDTIEIVVTEAVRR